MYERLRNLSYDGAGRLSTVGSSKNDATHPGLLWTANTYGPLGLTKATLGNGVGETRQYTNRGWLQSVSAAASGGQTVYSEALTYLPNGNVQTVIDPVSGNWTYSYDTLNRLSIAASPNTGQGCQFGYDPFGNRTQEAPYQGNCFSYALTFSTPTNHIDGYCYDGAGNLQDAGPCPSGGGNHQYYYDGFGNLSSPNFNTTNRSSYIFDVFRLRIAKLVGGQLTRQYLFGTDGNPVAEMDGSGNWLQTNVHAGGRFLAEYQGTDTYFQHVDHLGTVHAESNSAGARTETCANFPFGDSLNCNGNTSPSGYHFTGKEHDAESGSDYFGARYYASSMGRWMSPDWASEAEAVPYSDFSDPQSLNLYAYVRNNPLSRTDADGHAPEQGNPNGWTSTEGCQGIANCESLTAQQQNSSSTANADPIATALSNVPGVASVTPAPDPTRDKAIGGHQNETDALTFKTPEDQAKFMAESSRKHLAPGDVSENGFGPGVRLPGGLHAEQGRVDPRTGQFLVTSHIDRFNANNGLAPLVGHFVVDVFIGTVFFHHTAGLDQ